MKESPRDLQPHAALSVAVAGWLLCKQLWQQTIPELCAKLYHILLASKNDH
jgi:hypothetical protein